MMVFLVTMPIREPRSSVTGMKFWFMARVRSSSMDAVTGTAGLRSFLSMSVIFMSSRWRMSTSVGPLCSEAFFGLNLTMFQRKSPSLTVPMYLLSSVMTGTAV